MKTVPVIGLPVAATDYAGAVHWVLDHAARQQHVLAVEAANTHVAALARSNPDFTKTMSRFDLIVPDGMPLVWSMNSRLPGPEKLMDRVYGPDLMLKTFEATCGDTRFSHFLLGGRESTLAKLRSVFASRFPNATIAGSYSPPFSEWPQDESERIIAKIRDSRANLVWVGMGCPKQEHWIACHKDRLPPAVYFGIGAAFAFHAGEVRQAPPALQRLGLEWVYRLAMEPRRLFKRYLTCNSLFLWHTIRDSIRGTRS